MAEKDKIKQDAFLKLYEPANPRLSRYCHAMLRNREDARDLISDTLLTAYENFEKLRKPESFLYFLFGIASRQIKQKLRRKKFLGLFDNEKAEAIHDTAMQPEEATDLAILFGKLAQLPGRQKECIILYEISGFSLEEISELTGEKLSTIKSHMHRGRKKLQNFFKDNRAIEVVENKPFLSFNSTSLNVLQTDKSTLQ